MTNIELLKVFFLFSLQYQIISRTTTSLAVQLTLLKLYLLTLNNFKIVGKKYPNIITYRGGFVHHHTTI